MLPPPDSTQARTARVKNSPFPQHSLIFVQNLARSRYPEAGSVGARGFRMTESFRVADPVDRVPSVFVVGYPRSGTTVLRRLLSGHPGLVILPETAVFRSVPRACPRGPRSVADL